MRKIVYIFLAADTIHKPILEACSRHTSLVEPISEEELLLDLSAFNRIGDVLSLLVGSLAELKKGPAGIGVAASPLLALLAVRRRGLPAESKSSCRSLRKKGIDIIQIVPGREDLFMRSLPLEEFPPLSPREIRLLKRRGFRQVGDLADLGPDCLKQILKRDASTLWQNSCGRDYRPVRGLYPPERLGYSLALEEGCQDYNRLLAVLQEAARELGGLLEQRHAGCRQVELGLELSGGQILQLERQLASSCHAVSSLRIILEGLLPVVIKEPVTGLSVFLKDLKVLQMQAQDLFTLRYNCPEEAKKQRRADSMEQLLQRFPGSISLGMDIERREKVLLFWDPWRFSPGCDGP